MEEDCLCYMKQWACLLAWSYQKLPGMLHCMLRNKLYTYGNNGDMDFNFVNTIANTCEHSMIAGNTYKPWHSKIMLLHPIYYQGNIQLYQTWVKTTFALSGFTIYIYDIICWRLQPLHPLTAEKIKQFECNGHFLKHVMLQNQILYSNHHSTLKPFLLMSIDDNRLTVLTPIPVRPLHDKSAFKTSMG